MKAVIGLGFGDEGKGRVVDWLCSKEHHKVVRFSGGHQAAHNVIKDGAQHVFANFGSGTLRGCPTYWSEFCTVEPIGLLKELGILKSKGAHPKLIIHPKCPITTPYDIKKNQDTNPHGSCGVGFGQTLKREEEFYSLLFEDLFHPVAFEMKLRGIEKYYTHFPRINADAFIEACQKIILSENIEINDQIIRIDNVIFEGSQGLLLDQHYGFFPHVTRSNIGTTNIEHLLKNNRHFIDSNNNPIVHGLEDIHYYLVMRAYQTRHGMGPMTNRDEYIKENPYEQNFTNDYQGSFRKSVLDLNLIKYSINKDEGIRNAPNKTLVITCMDLMEKFVFSYNGNSHEYKTGQAFAKDIGEILGVEDILLSRDAHGEIIPL